MASRFSGLGRAILRHDALWGVAHASLMRLARFAHNQRYAVVQERIQAACMQSGVLSGPFQGLRYTHWKAVGSVLMPKLLGTYESELLPVWQHVQGRRYQTILDIGCAEGYYAVGLARMFPESRVYAYDISAEARELCQQMADGNGVSGRIEVGESCTSQTLAATDFGPCSLVFCDTDGYERDLFTPDLVNALRRCDLIIEIHPHLRPDVRDYLCRLFCETHQVQHFAHISDHEKVTRYVVPLVEEPFYDIRLALLREGRPGKKSNLKGHSVYCDLFSCRDPSSSSENQY